MMAFDRQRLGAFWFSSGTPTSLIALLKQDNVTIPELEVIEASEASFIAPTESMEDPVAFMCQSGYLTIKGCDPLTRTYTLGIPNAEAAEGLSRALLPLYTGTSGTANDGFAPGSRARC